MKKTRLSLLLIAFSATFSFGQTQIENGNFETWENVGTATEEPTEWSSLKTSTDDSWLNLANQAPQVIWQETTDAHGGSSCLKLVVAQYNALAGLAPNALVTNGQVYASTTPTDAYVFTNTSDASQNTICTDKPDSLIGWYKYAPENGDKGKVEILFHSNLFQGQLPDNGTTGHHVGSGITEFTTAQSTWQRFSFPINYTTTNSPNYFLIVATAGDETNAQTGSTLWLDDLSFVYNPTSPPPPPPTSGISVNQNNFELFTFGNDLTLNLSENFTNSKLKIYGLDGKLVSTTNIVDNKNKIQHNLSNGIYAYQLIIDNKIYKGKISISH